MEQQKKEVMKELEERVNKKEIFVTKEKVPLIP